MDIIKEKYSKLDPVKNIAFLADPACRSGWKTHTLPLLEHVWNTHRPDLFLVAGDLAVDGACEEFRDFIAAVRKYPAHFAAVPGDHDLPLKAFSHYFGSTRKIVDAGKWRFIGVNTANRVFPGSEADFLENNIRPNTVVFTHIPPGINGWTFHSFRPYYSTRFLSIVDRHKVQIKAAFFGHIHGYSRKKYQGIPFIATGGMAESFAVRNNRYDGPGIYQMMIFNASTGRIKLCKLD